MYSPSSYSTLLGRYLFQMPTFFSFSNEPVCINSPFSRYHFHCPVILPFKYLPMAFSDPFRSSTSTRRLFRPCDIGRRWTGCHPYSALGKHHSSIFRQRRVCSCSFSWGLIRTVIVVQARL